MNETTPPAGSPPGTYFDTAAADRICHFFECYLISPETGKPLRLSPWQVDMLRHVFGWKTADGFRLVRTLYLEIGKKNGKSALASGIALFMLAADGERSGEVYSVASDAFQAGIVFESAKKMAASSKKLAKIVGPYKFSLIHEKSGSSYRVLSATADTKDGIKASCILFDELHRQPDRRLWDVMKGASISREQPLTVVTTTAGYDRTSICYEVHEQACRIRDGKQIDPTFHAVIFAADEKDAFETDEEIIATARKANPNLGITIKVPEFLRLAKDAIAAGPAALSDFKRKHLGIWTQLATAWLPMAAWNACGKTNVDPTKYRGKRCHVGLDCSSTVDLTAIALLFPRDDDGYDLIVHHFMPRAKVIEAEERDRVSYRTWSETKLGTSDTPILELTDGSAIDYGVILRRILELREMYEFAGDEIAIDERNVWMLAQQLQAEGIEPVAVSPKTAGMSEPSKELHRQIVNLKLCHGANPLLDYEASVVEIREFDGEIRPVKGNGVMRKRIDGICAAILAMSRAMVGAGNQSSGPSVYETRGVFAI